MNECAYGRPEEGPQGYTGVLQREPLTLELAAEPGQFAGVRRQVAAHCERWGLGCLADPATLCVGELLANVAVHVGEGASVTVGLTWHAPHARLTVTDPDAGALPALVAAGPDAESGRGMALLAALAVRWGVEVVGEGTARTGKRVWCELAPE